MPKARSTAARTDRAAPPLVRSKLSQPNPAGPVLDRPRLLAALAEHAARSLTLVTAEAGYGKTTLLGAFAQRTRRPVVWYSLMPSDADPVVFGRYLLEGFRRDTPRFGRDFERALDEARPGARSIEMLGGTLANELATLRGPATLLVLDDFQEVTGNSQVVALTDTILRFLPASVRVVIASRATPPLALERLRAKGELFELTSSHLRLTREELAKLFAEVYRRPLVEAELAALEDTTLGWPTAVHLIHESLRRAPDLGLEAVIEDFRTSSLDLHDYLSVEVFRRFDDDSRRLLERTAALARFDVGLAAVLASLPDPRARLDALARRGLLRTYGSGDQTTYECHELVRRFLRQDVEARGGPDRWQELESEAGRALESRGDDELALRHYLAARRGAEASRLLRALAPRFLRSGRAATLAQYLGDLPAEWRKGDSTLGVALADAKGALGEWNAAEPAYDEALAASRASGNRETECRALVGLGKIYNLRGRHEQVLGMAERGLALAADLPLEIGVKLLQMKAGAHFYLGQFGAAVRVLDEVRSRLPDSADPELAIPTIHNLAVALHNQGRFREASEEFRAALAYVSGGASPRAALYQYNLALLLCDLGELAEARRAAEEGLSVAQRFSHRAQEAMCHLALSQALVGTGDLDGALSSLRRAEDLNAELRMEVIAADLLALRARVFSARGQYRRAVDFLERAIERLAGGADNPRFSEFQATLAWCELRAGRPRVAHDRLKPLLPKTEAGEDGLQRMRVHYWLAETHLALGEPGAAEPLLRPALALVRERGFDHFLAVQAREAPEPVLHALTHAIELDVVAAALATAGGDIEEPLLDLLERAKPAVAEAALSVLAELGGPTARSRLEAMATSRRELASAMRAALRRIGERLARAGEATLPASQTQAPRLTLFGPPRLTIDGRPVAASVWRSQRAFQVLVYLALHPEGATREELIELFWPGRRARAARQNFHPTLSYLRSALPRAAAPPIERAGETYRLNRAYLLTCDAWEIERAFADAKQASSTEERSRALERAQALAGAPYLQGFYADWAVELQARMRDRLEKLHLALGELAARRGDFDQAIDSFRRASELDEFRESTRLALMEALVRAGNRPAALAEYEKLKSRLRAELDVEPLPETDETVRRLLAGEAVHDWNVEATQPKPGQKLTKNGQAGLKPLAGVSPR
ncbi:MAG TPA: tetratricopeptide repeat protein [Candidatus Eisenbacteria bacterium]|nr:tetratricopeptide repeat protein [Candidatus Eisenbacteria bacterium]